MNNQALLNNHKQGGYILWEFLLILCVIGVFFIPLTFEVQGRDERIVENFVEILRNDISFMKYQGSTTLDVFEMRFSSIEKNYAIYRKNVLYKTLDYDSCITLTNQLYQGKIRVVLGMVEKSGTLGISCRSYSTSVTIAERGGLLRVKGEKRHVSFRRDVVVTRSILYVDILHDKHL